ncbi:MAG TPA: hypothetical protein VGE14_07275, partial [Marmoricola sp.]
MTIPFSHRRGVAAVAAGLAAIAAPLALGSPSSAQTPRDSDHDGMPNRWEVAHHLDAHRANAGGDPDRDGLRNLGEFRRGLDPQDQD